MKVWVEGFESTTTREIDRNDGCPACNYVKQVCDERPSLKPGDSFILNYGEVRRLVTILDLEGPLGGPALICTPIEL